MAEGTSPEKCAVCGQCNPQSFRLFFDGYLKLLRCKNCGFAFQAAGQEGIENYDDAYGLSFLDEGKEFMYPKRQRALADIRDRILKAKPTGKLLDVGCGDGQFLNLCKENFDCYGIEPSKQLSKYAAEKTDATVACDCYDKSRFEENSFDVITFIQVLEHLRNPLEALETAKFHLKPGGLIVIEVPSINAPHFLTWRFTGIKWFVRPPAGIIKWHWGYYSPKTLGLLAHKVGFEKSSLITGRWRVKYADSFPGKIALLTDGLFNSLKIGGILYLGVKK